MIKESISYIDFDGVEHTDEMYFHLTQLELVELTASYGVKDLEQYLNFLIQEKDLPKLLLFLKDLMLKSYGKKSVDGKRFIKGGEELAEFEQSLAFAELFEAIATDEKRGEAFAKSLFGNHKRPQDRQPQIANK